VITNHEKIFFTVYTKCSEKNKFNNQCHLNFNLRNHQSKILQKWSISSLIMKHILQWASQDRNTCP